MESLKIPISQRESRVLRLGQSTAQCFSAVPSVYECAADFARPEHSNKNRHKLAYAN